VNVDVKPFGSCEHSNVTMTGMSNMTLLHDSTADLKVQMVARDTDGHTIVRTACEFKVWLVHENSQPNELVVIRDGSDGSSYSATVPLGSLQREGTY
jgi:hypothetical protein